MTRTFGGSAQTRYFLARPHMGGFRSNTNRGLNNSSYPTRTEFNNCFIIYLYLQTFPLRKPAIRIFPHLVQAA